MEESEKENFEEARKLLEEADTFLNKAHQVQTDFNSKEAAGEEMKLQYFFVHAQDHPMTRS